MSEASDFAELQRLRPAEAIAYAAGRELAAQTFSAYDLWRDEHGRAFTVSRLARADLLEAMQTSLAKSVAGDLSRRDWIRNTEQLLQNAGWWGTTQVTDPRTGEVLKTRFNHARLQLIFDTNVRQAQAAGQWQRMLRNQRTHPYARYVTQDDGRVRPLHRSWHGVTLPLTDTWWATHRPPNGYRCRCRVVGVTKREYEAGVVLDRPGAATDINAPVRRTPMVKTAPPVNLVEWENPATGRTENIPAGIDPGFDYNAGTTGRSRAFDDIVQAKLARLTPDVASAARVNRLFGGLPSETFIGQRPGLADVPPVAAPRISSAALAAQAPTGPDQVNALATALGKALQQLQATGGLVVDDAGWLLAPADGSTRETPAQGWAWELRQLVRRAVVFERDATDGQARYSLASALVVDSQLYRVLMTVLDADRSASGTEQPHTLLAQSVSLRAIDQAGLQLRRTASGGVEINLADLLRGVVLRNGQPLQPD